MLSRVGLASVSLVVCSWCYGSLAIADSGVTAGTDEPTPFSQLERLNTSEPASTQTPSSTALPPAVSTPETSPAVPSGQPGAEPERQPTQVPERQAKLKEAAALRQKGNHAAALGIYEALLQQTPSDAELTVEKGRALIALARWEDAYNTFKGVFESKTTGAKWKALAFEGTGELFARNGLFKEGAQNTTAALRLNPNLDGALFWRARCEYGLGTFEKAAADFRQAGSLVLKSALYPSWEAMALIGTGDLSKAKEAIERSVAIQPDNSSALTARARLHMVSGEIEAAEADIAQLKQRGALNPQASETEQLIMIHRIMKPTDERFARPRP